MVKIWIILLVLCFSSDLMAAEFLLSKSGSGNIQVEMQGAIVAGDYKRLVSLIEDNPASFVMAGGIVLNSNGGSVSEALRIAELIDRAALTTMVENDGVCASSCFLVFVSGPIRYGLGDILIHRPYPKNRTYKDMDLSEISKAHQSVMLDVRRYLRESSVPAKFIDIMISKSSRDSYRLTTKDKIEIGVMTPEFEEASIALCGVSSKSVLNQKASKRRLNCTNNINTKLRLKYVSEIVGEERLRTEIRQFLLSNGGVESPNGKIVMPKQ